MSIIDAMREILNSDTPAPPVAQDEQGVGVPSTAPTPSGTEQGDKARAVMESAAVSAPPAPPPPTPDTPPAPPSEPSDEASATQEPAPVAQPTGYSLASAALAGASPTPSISASVAAMDATTFHSPQGQALVTQALRESIAQFRR